MHSNLLKCAIIEDDPLAAALLADYINDLPELELMPILKDGKQGLDFIQANQVDLLFLDIHIPHFTGLEVLAQLEKKPVTIITSSYAEFALEGFRLSVLDYLVKPFEFIRFKEAVDKAKEFLLYRNAYEQELQKGVSPPNHFFVKTDYKTIKINYDDIFYIEGFKQYAKIFTTEKCHIVLISLKKLLEELPNNQFKQIHKSYLINTDKLTSISSSLVEINKVKIPVGNTFKDSLDHLKK